MTIRNRCIHLVLLGFLLAGFIAPPLDKIKVGEHDATTPAPREQEWWQTRHNRFNEIAASGEPVDLVFLGDSITQGWENNGKDVWTEYYGERHAANFGIGGDRTQHVLWRIANGNFEGLSPKLIVLMIGTNNSGANTPREIADGVIAILQALRAKMPETKILLLGIFPRGEDDTNAQRGTNRATNAIIKTVADGEMIHYLDIGPAFLEDDRSLSKEIMPDLLHLSPEGYERWANAIEPQVKQLLED